MDTAPPSVERKISREPPRPETPASGQVFPTQWFAGIGRYGYSTAVRGENDQPVAPEHRTRPSHRVLSFLRVLVTGEEAPPAPLALVARQADQLVVGRQDINIIPGHPKAVGAAEFV